MINYKWSEVVLDDLKVGCVQCVQGKKDNYLPRLELRAILNWDQENGRVLHYVTNWLIRSVKGHTTRVNFTITDQDEVYIRDNANVTEWALTGPTMHRQRSWHPSKRQALAPVQVRRQSRRGAPHQVLAKDPAHSRPPWN